MILLTFTTLLTIIKCSTTVRYTPTWANKASDNLEIHTEDIPPISYSTGDIHSSTRCDGSECYLTIEDKEYNIGDAFRTVDSIFKINDNTFYLCSKDPNGSLYKFDVSTETLEKVEHRYSELDSCSMNGRYWTLSCSRHGKTSRIYVSYIDGCHTFIYDYNQKQWQGSKVVDIRKRIIQSTFNPTTTGLFILYSQDEQLSSLKLRLYKINFDQGLPIGGDSPGEIAINETSHIGQVEAAFTVTDTTFQLFVVVWNQGEKTIEFITSESVGYSISDKSYINPMNTTKSILKFPLNLKNDYTFNQLTFINGKPICIYSVTDTDGVVYWGAADLEQQAVLYNSNAPMLQISPIADSTNSKYLFMVIQSNSYMVICPQGTTTGSCTRCEGELLLEPTYKNYCLAKSTAVYESEQVNGNVIICKPSLVYDEDKNQCAECKGYIMKPGDLCVTECNTSIYALDTNTGTCTNCKGIGQYYDSTKQICVDLIPNGYYEKDPANGIIAQCTSPCKNCKLGNSGEVECTSCDADNLYLMDGECVSSCINESNDIYAKDEATKTCKTCPSINANYVKELGKDMCVNIADIKYFYYHDETNGVIVKCNEGCNSCSKSSLCESCIDDLYQAPNFETTPQCVSDCSKVDDRYGKYIITDTNTKKCINCYSEAGLFLYGDDEQCKAVTGEEGKDYIIIDQTYGVVLTCPNFCDNCSEDHGSAKCNACKEGTTLNEEGKCSNPCKEGEGLLNSVCVNCKTAGYYLKENTIECIETKPPGYFISNTNNNILSPCDGTCLECSGYPTQNDNKCTACPEGKLLSYYNHNCIDTCDHEFAVVDNNKCINCKNNKNGNTVLYYGEPTCSPAPTANDPPTYVISPEFGVIGVCDTNCNSCKLDTNDDSYGSICVKCESGFYMKYDTDECSSTCAIGDVPDNYFGKNPQTTKCEKCPANTNGKNYKLENGNECISLSPNDVYHVIDNEYGIIVKCHSNCAECAEGPTEDDNKCTKCKSKYFKESDSSTNCVEQCNAYLVENTVEGKCENCKLSNPVEMYYYKGKCIDEQLEGTVLVDETTNGLRDCYFGCSKCTTAEFNEDDHQCLSCKADFSAEKTSSDGIYKCVTDCDRSVYKWYVDSENMFYCLNEDNNNACPTTHPLLIESTNECVHTCPNNIKYNYNNNCVNACPSGYRANPQNKCIIISNNDNTSDDEYEGDYSLCEERMNAINTEYDSVELLLRAQMDTFKETTTIYNIDTLVDIITGDDVTIIVFSNFTCVQHFALNYNISYADVSTCLNKLITYHSLPQTYKFIIGQSELKRSNESTNQISGYLISDVNGNSFDLTPCKDETITVTYPLQESTLEEYNTTKEFYMETGINLYDSSAPFFNDFCESFHDEHNNDVILQDRRKYMFKNASFCEEGCKYSDINFAKSVVHCDCSSKENNFDTVLPSTPMEEFKYKLKKTNLKVLKCHSVFNSKRYADNAGGIVMITVMIAAVPAIVHLFVVGFNPMYTNLNSLAVNMEGNVNDVNNGNGGNGGDDNLQSMSKSKDKSNQLDDGDNNNNNDNDGGDNNNNDVSNNNNNPKPNPPKRNTNTISSTLSNNSNLITESPSQLMNKQKNNESSTMQLAQPAKLPLKDDINEKESPISLTETNLNVLTSTKLDEKQIKNTSDNLYTDEDQEHQVDPSTSESILDEAPYDDALIYDKRNILLLYWRCLQRRLFILNIIMHSSPYEPFTAKIIGVILILSFMLSLNGMFFNEGYISERYLAKDKVNGSFICKNELPKTIYSCLITIIFCYCVELVLNTRKCFKDVAKDEKDKEKFFEKTKQITKCVKIRLIIFVVVSMLLIIFFWYYISTFCGVYTKTQGGLFIGFCFSIIFFYVFQAVLIFIIALMRYIGITCKYSWLYKASSFIM